MRLALPKCWSAPLCAGIALFSVSTASAAKIDVLQGADPTSSFSVLHQGQTAFAPLNGHYFWMSGGKSRIGDAPGFDSLEGTLDLPNFSITDIVGTLNIDDLGPFAGGGEIEFTGGFLDFDSPAPGSLVGRLDYRITGTSTVLDRPVGSFYFYNYDFTGDPEGPNSMIVNGNTAEVQLWGNNYSQEELAQMDPADFGNFKAPPGMLGVDLLLRTSVPDGGSTGLLMGLPLVLFGLSRIARRCR